MSTTHCSLTMVFHQVLHACSYGISIRKRLLQAPMLCMDLVVEAQLNDRGSVISLEASAHHWGPGGGSTAERPRFSNKPGSECSSLGRFLVTKEHGYTLKRSFRIKGMDFDNQSAYARGLMIHKSGWVDSHCWMRYIPLHRASCQGCVTVSSRGMNYLWSLINKENKPILLWNFY